MTPATLIAPGEASLKWSAGAAAPRPTLDDVLTGAWSGLAAHRTVECLVCVGPMQPRHDAGSRPDGGCCGRCGSTLA